jgi:tetratricopeptide (TPR) repeat protein
MIYRFTRSIRRFFSSVADRLRDLGQAITSPIERALAALFGPLVAASENFNRVEDWILALGKIALWPFATFWRLIIWMSDLLLPAALRKAPASLASRVGRLGRSFGRGAVKLAERFNLDIPFRWAAWLLQPLWRPIAAVGGFLYVWLATRPYRQMAWGVPALVLLVPVGAAAGWGLLWGRGSVAAHYRLAVKEAREAGNYERVQLFERKLAQLGADTQQMDFNTALALANDGKMQQAYERMQKLAPLDEPGYLQARVWIIQQLIKNELQLPREDIHRLLGAHLTQLKAAGVDPPQLQVLRAGWLVEEKKFKEAADLLAPHVDHIPAAALLRMSFDLMLGIVDEAKVDARAVRGHFEERRRQQALNATESKNAIPAGAGGVAQTTAEEYRMWAIAEGLVGDLNTQSAVVDLWARDYPDDPLAKKALAERARIAVDEEMRGARPDGRQLAERIIQAASLGGDAAALQRQIGAIYQQRNQSPVAQVAIDELKKSPDAPEIVLQILGTYAVVSGEPVEARDLLKRAVEKAPRDAVAWNNYACALMEIKDADLQEALSAVNKALEVAPDAPQFHETRGQIFVRLKQWDKAVEDLELAINGMPDSKVVHRSLADAYAALGQNDLATIHRDQAK